MNHGPNLFPGFFGDITEMGWPGQFYFDFMYMLLLSGSYIAWRQKFSAAGLCLSLVGGFFLVAPFLFCPLISYSAFFRLKETLQPYC